jgi:two-component system response regulator AtoC
MNSTSKVLVIDDDLILLDIASRTLTESGYTVVSAETAEQGEQVARDARPDMILLDINIPQMGGEALLQKLRVEHPSVPVVVFTAQKDTDLAVRCIKAGAYDFLQKNCESARLLTTVRNALHARALEKRLGELRDGREDDASYDELYGESDAMRKVFAQLKTLERSDISVCIEGPSGTGKELVARALHKRGARSKGPFIAINCGAIPETMLESELFGHEKGAFTGAINVHVGCFEQAHRGTLFLDEIGDMRADLQTRLLRALENREVRRIGGTQTIQFDVRVVCATHQDLKNLVAQNRFREDLYYRLAVFRIALPPLHARGHDVVGIAERFIVEFSARLGKRVQGLTSAAGAVLLGYPWPGNVRELRNAVERAVLLCEGAEIGPEDLPEDVLNGSHANEELIRELERMRKSARPSAAPANLGVAETAAFAQPIALPPMAAADNNEIIPIEVEEMRIIERALRITGGDIQQAANRLQIGQATLYRKIAKFQFDLGNIRGKA